MLKGALLVLLIALVVTEPCNGTTGQQDQINDTTTKICPGINIKSVNHSFSSGSVTLSNITLNCIFYDGSQVGKAGDYIITVTGGRIQFQTNFIITLNQSGKQKTGTASVFSDGTNFTKHLTYGSGRNLRWILQDNSIHNVSAKQNFTVRRHTVSEITADQLNAVLDSLNNVTGSVKEQILTQYNSNFSAILNQTLTEQKIFTPEFNYTYHHSTGKDLVIQFQNNISNFGLNQADGLILEFDTHIKGEQLDCINPMPKHDDYRYFGGIQTIHSMDFYQHVFNYIFKQKWLNVDLNTDWNINAFQFYAGDLYQIIPKVSTSIPPRTKIAGSCTALKDDHLLFKRNSTSRYSATINYNCQLMTQTNIKVSQFQIKVEYLIRVYLQYESIHYRIFSAQGTPVFKATGDYVVTNFLLAQFKMNEILKSLAQHKVIGDNFPSWPRDHPNVDVRQNYTLFYDSSHVPHLSVQ